MNPDDKLRLQRVARVASVGIFILAGIALIYQSGSLKWYSLLGVVLLILGGYLISSLKK